MKIQDNTELDTTELAKLLEKLRGKYPRKVRFPLVYSPNGDYYIAEIIFSFGGNVFKTMSETPL